MLNETLADTFEATVHNLPEPALERDYFFHDVRVTCQTDHPAMLAILDEMFGIFPEPEKQLGEFKYIVLCYESVAHFPVQLPASRKRTATVRLLTDTRLKYYVDRTSRTEYQSYEALPPVNGTVLTAISRSQNVVLTQLESPGQYQATFLRRYVFLLALGQFMSRFGFEPCHAAAITAPWDNEQGALIIGASGSGKTTLSLGCANIGCGFLGDDLMMLRNDAHLINAYTIMREVSVRSDSLDLWQALSFLRAFPADDRDKHYCTIEEIRNGATRIQTPIRLLIFTSLSTEKKSRLTPLSKARTLQMLVDECLSKKYMYPQAQEQFFSLLCKLSEQARGYQLAIARGATDGPRIVRSLFTGSS